MDLAQSIEPNSEQLNAEDLLVGPRTVTVTRVEKGTKDQPVFIHLAEFEGRTYRPGKSMRRVLVSCWGADSSAYTGRRITMYNDPTVRWAGKAVGGIRISHLSDITEQKTINLTVTRGTRAPFVVQPLDPPAPLVDESGRDWLVELADAQGDVSAIEALGTAAKAAHATGATLAVIRSAYLQAKAADHAPEGEQ